MVTQLFEEKMIYRFNHYFAEVSVSFLFFIFVSFIYFCCLEVPTVDISSHFTVSLSSVTKALTNDRLIKTFLRYRGAISNNLWKNVLFLSWSAIYIWCLISFHCWRLNFRLGLSSFGFSSLQHVQGTVCYERNIEFGSL